MPPRRADLHTVLLDPQAFDGDTVRLTGEAYRHLFRAARLAVGDAVRVVDGRSRARHARVAAVDRSSGLLELGQEAPSLEAGLRVELLVATPQPQRADWLVEKATELGIAAVRFLATERSPRRLAAPQIARLARVARSAVEQCGRARLPEVTGPHPWPDLPILLADLPYRFYLDPAPEQPERPQEPASAVAVLIGPEGGWTDRERRDLEALSCRALSLGPRTLRVETAAIVAGALLLCSPMPRVGVGGSAEAQARAPASAG